MILTVQGGIAILFQAFLLLCNFHTEKQNRKTTHKKRAAKPLFFYVKPNC
jgi:hypothetical protein